VNIVDENIPLEERLLLKKWRIPSRFIGQEIARFGVKDPDILRVLHHLKQPTLFTRDDDFFLAVERAIGRQPQPYNLAPTGLPCQRASR
jgi:hypothetical protein